MALLPEGPQQAKDLSLLAHEDEAEAAFLRMWALMREPLTRAARRFGLSDEDVDDVAQSVSATLWERRGRLAEMSVGAFWAFAFRSTKNLAIDQARRKGRGGVVPIDEGDVPTEEMAYLDAVVEATLERDGVYAAADRLWLGDHDGGLEAILSVQMCLLEGASPEEAGAMLGLTSETVRDLAGNPLVARHATYRALMWESEDLAGFVLDPFCPPSISEVEGLLRRARRGEPVKIGGWRSLEVAVVILRVRFGMSEENISRLLAPDPNDLKIDDVVRLAVAHYPFPRIAETALAVLRDCLEEGPQSVGLWRRLVFEYHTRMQLPHKQILERAAPAASVLSVDLKPTTLNSWIGNGRLWSQLAAFIAKEGER